MSADASLQLRHYAAQRVTLNRGRKYQQPQPQGYAKPVGFWVSIPGDDDWPSWCQSENFGLGEIEHTVDLAPTANVLHIKSAAELVAFHSGYAVETERERRYRDSRRSWPIDWPTVAATYDGLIIAPYQWTHRFNVGWYYGWDCASGCIWNLDAIASVTAEKALA